MPLNCEVKYVEVLGSDDRRYKLPLWHVPKNGAVCRCDVRRKLLRAVERMQENNVWPSNGYEQLLMKDVNLLPESVECLSTSTSV
jgi:hypothetical protein